MAASDSIGIGQPQKIVILNKVKNLKLRKQRSFGRLGDLRMTMSTRIPDMRASLPRQVIMQKSFMEILSFVPIMSMLCTSYGDLDEFRPQT